MNTNTSLIILYSQIVSIHRIEKKINIIATKVFTSLFQTNET